MLTRLLERERMVTTTASLTRLSEIEEAAMKLNEDDRRTLALRLRRSLELDDLECESTTASDESPPLSPEWLEEIQRRSREIDDGSVQAVPFVDPLVRLEQLRGGA